MVKKKVAEHHEASEEQKESKKKFDFSKVNYWMVATALLAVVLLVMVSFSSFTTISKKTAGNKAIELANMSGLALTVNNVEDLGDFYGVNYTIQGQQGILHITKDGKYIGQMSEFPKTTAPAPASDTDKDKCSQDAATRFGMDAKKIEELAFSSEGIALLKVEADITNKYSVSGSPTLIINGVQSKAIYTGTDATKSAICSSFITKPSECDGVAINTTGVKKTQKPVVELFVMSYCPYGVRAQTTIAPLVDLFGDKVDFKIRFIVQVSGNSIESAQSLHGLTEAKEDARQLAIMKLYPEKYWTYLEEFNNVCYGGGAASSGSC